MSPLLRTYQILATIVGCSTIFVVGAWQAKMWTDEFSWWNQNTELISAIDVAHGFLFMGLLVLVALLSRRHGWSIPFTLTTMLLATIPFVSFWAERRASHSILRDDAQASPAAP